jgi:hypothetical protein
MEKELLEKIKELVKKTPNDYNLGSLIRSVVNSYSGSDKK